MGHRSILFKNAIASPKSYRETTRNVKTERDCSHRVRFTPPIRSMGVHRLIHRVKSIVPDL